MLFFVDQRCSLSTHAHTHSLFPNLHIFSLYFVFSGFVYFIPFVKFSPFPLPFSSLYLSPSFPPPFTRSIMGSKNSTENSGGYVLDGPQDFEFDEQKMIFEKGNGMLFRLINNSAHQWAFYNDTKKYEFHITVTFGSQSRNLQALGKTSLVELPEGGWCAKVIVYPGLTEPFIQGEPVGFDVNANCVLLTTEYQEKKKAEKHEAKKEAKEAKKAAKAAQEGN